MTIAATPNTTEIPRQPMSASSGVATTATTTVPTLPPAMWALMANPRRSGGNCSASRPLPTGCCGEPPIRATRLAMANVPKPVASACAANPPPNRRPPRPSSRRRDTRRVSSAYDSWTRPEANAPTAASTATAPTPTPNSSMIARKMSGSRTAKA